jgi:hypothetical protein
MRESDQLDLARVDRYICAENIVRFRHLLTVETVGAKYKMLLKLLDEELQKQRGAGDSTNESKAWA